MFAVVFEVNPHPNRWGEYLGHAALLRPELLEIEGFVANERYASLGRPGWLVSLSTWRDEKALIRWRTHALHHEIQGKGRGAVFADYHLRVGEIVADTRPGPGDVLLQQRFDATEAGAAKALTLDERPVGDIATAVRAAPDLVGSDSFDSLANPGNGLTVNAWRTLAAAGAAVAPVPGRQRVVRVIRDYGMFARHEAPQYYPPVQPPARPALPG